MPSVFTRKRLLFVDDEPGIRETLSAVLRRYGLIVHVAANLSEAFDEIQKYEFDLLLSDLNIEHERDGYQVIRAMRKTNPNCINIILTAHPDVSSAVEGIHQAIDDYIIKPAYPEEIVAMLAEKLVRRCKGKVLTVSYDEPVQRTWRMLLEARGYQVLSPVGFESSIEAFKGENPDVFVLGRSVPPEDKERLVTEIRAYSGSPIISVEYMADTAPADGADFHVAPDPEIVLRLIGDLLRKFVFPRAIA